MLESIVLDHIMVQFVNNQLFSTPQLGFLKGRNTVLQPLKMLDGQKFFGGRWPNTLQSQKCINFETV